MNRVHRLRHRGRHSVEMTCVQDAYIHLLLLLCETLPVWRMSVQIEMMRRPYYIGATKGRASATKTQNGFFSSHVPRFFCAKQNQGLAQRVVGGAGRGYIREGIRGQNMLEMIRKPQIFRQWAGRLCKLCMNVRCKGGKKLRVSARRGQKVPRA